MLFVQLITGANNKPFNYLFNCEQVISLFLNCPKLRPIFLCAATSPDRKVESQGKERIGDFFFSLQGQQLECFFWDRMIHSRMFVFPTLELIVELRAKSNSFHESQRYSFTCNKSRLTFWRKLQIRPITVLFLGGNWLSWSSDRTDDIIRKSSKVWASAWGRTTAFTLRLLTTAWWGLEPPPGEGPLPRVGSTRVKWKKPAGRD